MDPAGKYFIVGYPVTLNLETSHLIYGYDNNSLVLVSGSYGQGGLWYQTSNITSLYTNNIKNNSIRIISPNRYHNNHYYSIMY